MRILILGGTGFIGKPLSRQLATQGHDICIVSRGERVPEMPDGARRIRGDRFELQEVAADIDGFDPEIVIDVYAMTASGDLPVFEFFGSRVRRYVMLSSCDVYRAMGRVLRTEPGPVIEGLQSETGLLREKLHPYQGLMDHAGGSDYDKIPLEHACLSDFAFEGTVLRLPMIYGPGDRQHRFRDMVKHMADDRPAILFPENYASWISTYGLIDNVVAAIAHAATHDAAGGEIYNVGDVNDLTQKGWAEAIAGAMNWPGDIITMPRADLPEKRAALGRGHFEQMLRIDSSKIVRDLSFAAPVDFASAVAAMVDYELAHLTEIAPDTFDYAADDKAISACVNR